MRIFDRQISASIEPTRHKLNFEHFKYVVENCRKADNIEISLTGFTKETLVNSFATLEDGLTGTEDTIPFLDLSDAISIIFSAWIISFIGVLFFFEEAMRKPY